MKKIIFFILILFLSLPCFAQDDGFMEEYIDIDAAQPQFEQKESKEIDEEEESDKIKEFDVFAEQNEKEKAELKKQIENEEDGIVRLELEKQIKTKEIEYQAQKYILDWNDKINEMSVQKIMKEAANIKKQATKLLDDYENILETNNDFMLDKVKTHVTENQTYEQMEDLIIYEDKNKVLISMIQTLKPFIEQLNVFQRYYFKSEGNNRVKISSLYKINSKHMNIKIIYVSEQTVIYNLKYNISSLSKEKQSLISKNSKTFTIVPVFSVTQNNNGTITKMLTGFNVKNSNVETEQIIKVPSNVKEFYEIKRYKKMLKQYNE